MKENQIENGGASCMQLKKQDNDEKMNYLTKSIPYNILSRYLTLHFHLTLTNVLLTTREYQGGSVAVMIHLGPYI